MATAVLTDTSLLRESAVKKSDGFWISAFHRMRRNKLAMASACFLIALSLIAIFVPMFYRYDYAQQDYTAITLMDRAGPTRWEPISSGGTS